MRALNRGQLAHRRNAGAPEPVALFLADAVDVVILGFPGLTGLSAAGEQRVAT